MKLHALRCPQHVLSLGLHFNVVGADVLQRPFLLYVKSRLFLPSTFQFSLATLKCNPRQGLTQVNNMSIYFMGGNDMIPRRLGRVAIISSIGGLRPTCLGLPAGGVVDKGPCFLRKHCFLSHRLLVAVAAGDGMLKDGQHKLLAADAKA